VASWTASPQRASTGFGKNWSEDGFSDQTIRQVVRVSAGGRAARIRLSNLYGTSPLSVRGVTVARAAAGAEIEHISLRHLTFDGSRSVRIPAGGEVASDAAWLRLASRESVTVTMYLARTTGPATFHAQAFATTYRAPGDQRTAAGAKFTETTQSWYYLSGVDVLGGSQGRHPDGRAGRRGVATFGDSITDGFGSTVDENRRFSDALADRFERRPVINAGIGGNLLLNDSAWYGERATARFERDVLEQPGVGTAIVLVGINDIGFSETDTPTYKPNPRISARQLIRGYRALIRQAHAADVRIIGATLLPFEGSDHDGTRAARVSDRVNDWIRASGEFDAVADFDRALASPDDPDELAPAYDSGDHLHPNDAGYQRMAAIVRLR
jgi:lysophospholipase L1-like esterase